MDTLRCLERVYSILVERSFANRRGRGSGYSLPSTSMSQRSPGCIGPSEIEIVFAHRELVTGKPPAPSAEIRDRAFFTVVQRKHPRLHSGSVLAPRLSRPASGIHEPRPVGREHCIADREPRRQRPQIATRRDLCRHPHRYRRGRFATESCSERECARSKSPVQHGNVSARASRIKADWAEL